MWPLLRSQCVRALRRPHIRALASTPSSAHGATLSLRLPHSTVDTPNVTPTADSRGFPIDVMDRQLALRSLESLVRRGQTEQASKQLANILAASTLEWDWQLFLQLHDVIVWTNPEKPNLALAMDLGIAAASKGHRRFARKKIMPIIERFGTPEMWEKFDREISSFVESQPGTLSDKQLFENVGEDYAAAAPVEITPEPSILEIVEQNLPATLPVPVDGDASLFEDATLAEYSDPIPGDSIGHSRHISIGHLKRLIIDGKYDQAYRLLTEMKELGVDIPPNQIFAVVARTLVKEGGTLTPELSDELLTWLSLVPEQNRIVLEELTTMAGHLSDSSWISMNLLMRVTLIYASKGYIVPIKPMLNVICHGVREQQLRNFIQEYEAAYLAFWKRTTPEMDRYRNSFIADTRNTVTRILGGTGRHGEIESYLPSDGSYKLWPSTYAHVLLYPMSEETRERLVHTLSELEGEKNNEETIRKINVQSLEDPIDFSKDLVAGIKYLKRSVHSKTTIPHPLTISSFANAYLSSGRSKGLQIIFDRALKGNRAMARTFLLGEMSFYRRLQHYDLVIETFVNHFYLMGVPHKVMLPRYRETLERRRNHDRHGDEEPPLQRFYKFDKDIFLGKKMIPLTLHCNVVWDALIASSSRPFVERLYAQFLHEAHKRDPQWRKKWDSSYTKDTLDGPMVQPSSFVPFLRPLMSLNGPRAGSQIIKDVLDLRLAPHQHIYTEVAGAYAREGNVDEAFAIMHQLESRKKSNHRPRNGPTMRVRSPPPDFAFYVAVLKGFLLSKNVEAAEEVARRVESKFKLEPGQNFKYDQALEWLINLKSRMSQFPDGDVQKLPR